VAEEKVELTPSGNDDDTLLVAVVVVTAGDMAQELSSIVVTLQSNSAADVGLAQSLSSSQLLNVRFRLDEF
jgi:hypothetical protein